MQQNLNVRALFNAEDNGNDSTGYMRADAYAGAAGTLVGGSGAFADVILDGKTTAEVKERWCYTDRRCLGPWKGRHRCFRFRTGTFPLAHWQ